MDLRDAYALAEHLLEVHGLSTWTVAYDSAKRRAGVCRFATRTVGLSAPLTALHSEAEVRDTILHEVAHALVGPRHGHDQTWRRTAIAIGCSGERCAPADAPTVEAAWLGVCPDGHTLGRHRRPERVMSCPWCGSQFDVAHLLSWTHRGRPGVMHPNYVAELDRMVTGQRATWIRVGGRARITVDGEHHGAIGKVVKRGRTSYHLKVGSLVFRVPFACVEPLS